METSVSLYSFQEEFFSRRMSLEDIFAYLSANGIYNIEILPDQMLHGMPTPSRETVEGWHSLLNNYKMKPVCVDFFLNSNLYANRTLRQKECVALLADEIAAAHALGFKLARMANNVPSDILKMLLPYAEQYDVVLARELTAGTAFESEDTLRFIDEVRRLNSPYLGLVIDTGMFCRRPPRVFTEFYRQQGATEKLIDYVEAIYAEGEDFSKYCKRNGGIPVAMEKLIKIDADRNYINTLPQYGNNPLSVLDKDMDIVKHFHMKSYEVSEAGTEYSIDDESIIRYLSKNGYSGYLSTEYEGSRWVLPGQPMPEKLQVLRHQQLLRRCLLQLT